MLKMEAPGSALLVEHGKLAEHFKDVQSFQAMRETTRKRLSRVMIGVTAVALLGNLAQAWTIASLVPLVRIVPVYLWVRRDGTIDSSVSVSQLPATQNAAVITAALWEYVRLREGYSFDTAQYGYDIVSAYSTPNVAEQYQKWFNYPNSQSPQILIGKRGSIMISYISSFDIGPSLRQIRFTRTIKLDNREPIITTMTATIGFATVNKLPAGSRLTNPGGVMVTSYQVSEDSPK